MRVDSVRTHRGVALATVALTLALVGGCGGSSSVTADGSGESQKPKDKPTAATASTPAPASSTPGAAKVTGKTLSKVELEGFVLAKGDVAGFAVAPMEGAPPMGETADKAECLPLTALLGGKPEPAPSAAVYRQIVGGKGEQTVVTEFLTAHRGQEAGQVLARLNKAVADCADGFTAHGGESPSTYSGVKKLPSPQAGDEALAYQLSGAYKGEEVPLVFQVVRTGTTVATFYTANLVDAKTPEIPAAISTAQAAKLK
ncbi:hypothetical protein ACFYXH_03295 [Streptomyces sp. NPDC002730]|uniref:hypothetical protein n=1 Tax=Streptomyces sp. NPDC002730 TaxID=3364662 RepID=UPI0036B53736